MIFMNDVVRYYEGRVKVKKISKITAKNTALYELLEDGILGSKRFGFREGRIGEIIHCPVRVCFKIKKTREERRSKENNEC